ncbi:hypothetical protein CPter291_2960 [Collimonas pratensis]|uniref:Uncharacterized protein n=1 Tax=Collimonas pratensis TaxID=279113 RepID=A0ABM5Z7Y3_9BURK|nr:hypothetical protein CPter291_2960 [Collimonas pratensis]
MIEAALPQGATISRILFEQMRFYTRLEFSQPLIGCTCTMFHAPALESFLP